MLANGRQGLLEAVAHYLDAGGMVMPALVVVSVLLWYAIGSRWALLARGSRKNVRVLIRRREQGRGKPPRGIVDAAIARGLSLAERQRAGGVPLRRRLDEAFADYELAIRRHAVAITALVAIAPMLGLLGTVMGMIETFESLGDMTMFSQTGGIASGIATALFTTQLGLVVAVPGVLAKAVLDRRAGAIAHDLAQVKDLLVSRPPQES